VLADHVRVARESPPPHPSLIIATRGAPDVVSSTTRPRTAAAREREDTRRDRRAGHLLGILSVAAELYKPDSAHLVEDLRASSPREIVRRGRGEARQISRSLRSAIQTSRGEA
jgi:hypothetical protein